jgi:hypothetical protein
MATAPTLYDTPPVYDTHEDRSSIVDDDPKTSHGLRDTKDEYTVRSGVIDFDGGGVL